MNDLLNEQDFKVPVEQSFKNSCRWYYINAALSMAVYGFFVMTDLAGLEGIALLAVIIVAIGLAFRMVFLEPERAALKTGHQVVRLSCTYVSC